MAQNKRRKKKHKGTQAGTISQSTQRARPKNRHEARSQSKQRREARLNRPPSWRSAAMRAAFAAVLFFVVIMVIGEKVSTAILLSIVAVVFYLPVGYYTDKFMWKRHQKKKAEQAMKSKKD